MKKLLMICLAACLALTALAAAPGGEAAEAAEPEESSAEVIDLSGFEDEELVALLDQVQTEIVARNIEKTAQLPSGTYVFGKDIPVGKYLLKKGEEEQGGMVSLAAADDPEDKHPSKLYTYADSEKAFEGFITAEEGDTLTVSFPCTLTISAGVVFQ